MSWSTSELRVRLAPLNRFKPSSKIFYWPFVPRQNFFCVSFMFFFCLVFAMSLLCGHLLGKGWPLGSRLWCLTVNLSLSHWYPGSGVVLDCIDSWSLHPYLLQPASTGFSWKILCNRNVRTYGKHTEAIANGEDIDIVYLDCCKAFDKVPHKKLLHTLYIYGITGQIFNWVKDFLSCKRQC